MLSLLLWMVTEFDNASSEVHREQPLEEDWSKLSFVLRVFLPITGLLILFKQKHVLARLLLQLDRNCVSVFCPSFSRREKLLKWAGSRLPETWSSQSKTLAGGVAELWTDGSLLCTLINSAIPGACPNPHRHWKKPPLHAQAIAYKYLGVIPIFTENELKGNLTVTLERNFLHYLNELQQAIIKLSEKNDIPKSISIHYVVRGMGLYSGEQHRKTVFYIYPNTNTTGQNSNIIVHIRGPYATYGKAIIPKFHKELFATPEINVTAELLSTQNLLIGHTMKPKNSFMRNFSLPFMQYHKKHMGDNIVIDVTMEDDRAKVTYIPKNYGMYEIIMVSNGELIRGCPFNVHILNNVSGIEDSFDCEDKAEDIPSLRRRKILSKTIDFIDEEMPIADILKKYKSKEENMEVELYVDSYKSSKKKIEGKIEMEEEKVSDELLVLHGLVEDGKKIIEEDKGFHFLDNKINDCADKSNLNMENDVCAYNDESIPEKQNSESTSENREVKSNTANINNLIPDILNVNNQTRGIIHKVNYCADNRSTHKVASDDVSVGLQLQSTSESTCDDKKITDVPDHKTPIYNDTCKTNSDDCSNRITVNKIRIPEIFCDPQNVVSNKFHNEIDTKYFKNVINTTNKKERPKRFSEGLYEDHVKHIKKATNHLQNGDTFPAKTSENLKNNDINNNTPSLNHDEAKQSLVNAFYRRNSKLDLEKMKVVPNRFLQCQQHPQTLEPPLDNPTSTSPICPNHIVPEVENDYGKMSVAEKRKMFSMKVQDKISSSTNSSFSDTENAEGSPKRSHFGQFEGLSVLNYLSSLKKSECIKNRETYPLCSTMSLPNISSMENGVFQNSVKERKNFWEKVSSSSSSLSLNSEVSWKRKSNKLTETERCKLIWKKPYEVTASSISMNTTEGNRNVEKNSDIRKSADDILSITNLVAHDTPKKFKSMDHSLDKCTMMSIDERKRMLLKQDYEKEVPKKQSPGLLRNDSIIRKKLEMNKTPEIIYEDQNSEDTLFSSVVERIKKYDSACNLSHEKIEEQSSNTHDNNNTSNVTTSISKNNYVTGDEEPHHSPQTEIRTVKSHFKRAIKYFKNLEKKSLNKPKASSILKDCRRFSLNLPSNKYRNHKKGGSLSLPSVTQRFSISNLYEDVFGGKRGNFKGAANRSALVEALATFSRKENRGFKGDEDNIMYEMFQKRTKTKSRRSIRSIFDVYY